MPPAELNQWLKAGRKLMRQYPNMMWEIEKVRVNVLGIYPKEFDQKSFQRWKTHPKGVYEYHDFPNNTMMDSARKVFPGLQTEQGERRRQKLMQLRRRGAGPPPKGQGRKKR